MQVMLCLVIDLSFTFDLRWPIVYEKLLPFKNRVPWYAHPEALQNSFIVRGALTAVLKVIRLK